MVVVPFGSQGRKENRDSGMEERDRLSTRRGFL